MAAGTSALLIAIAGGVAGVAALAGDDAKPRVVTAVGDKAAPDAAAPGADAPDAAGAGAAGGTAGDGAAGVGTVGADAAAAAAPSTELPRPNSAAVPTRTPGAAGRNPDRPPLAIGVPNPAKAQPGPGALTARQPGRPVITTRTETVTREIPYPSRTVPDPGMPSGSQRVQTPGVAGEQTLRYVVTLTDGRQTARRLLDSTVTRPPQQEVIAVGDGTGQCGPGIDLCVPLSRDPACRHLRRDESAGVGDRPEASDGPQVSDSPEVTDSAQAGAGGQVGVSGNDLAVLAGGRGDGPDDWQGDWHHHGHGRGC